jgi:hypothetical protein
MRGRLKHKQGRLYAKMFHVKHRANARSRHTAQNNPMHQKIAFVFQCSDFFIMQRFRAPWMLDLPEFARQGLDRRSGLSQLCECYLH